MSLKSLLNDLSQDLNTIRSVFENQIPKTSVKEIGLIYYKAVTEIYLALIKTLFHSEALAEKYFQLYVSFRFKDYEIDNVDVSISFWEQVRGFLGEFEFSSKRMYAEVATLSLRNALNNRKDFFNCQFLGNFSFFPFFLFILRFHANDNDIKMGVSLLQRAICDLYLNSDLYFLPFMSISELFFVGMRGSKNICANGFARLLLKYIPQYENVEDKSSSDIIKEFFFTDLFSIKFCKKVEGVNSGMRIIIQTDSNQEIWYYKSYHLASVSLKEKDTIHKDTNEKFELAKIKTQYSNSRTTIPIIGIGTAFLSLREPLLCVILHGLNFAPFSFFHVNPYIVGGFYIVSKGLNNYVLWNEFDFDKVIFELNQEQQDCLLRQIIEINILSALLGLYDLHSGNIMVKNEGDFYNIQIIDFAYSYRKEESPNNIELKQYLVDLNKIFHNNIRSLRSFNTNNSFMSFLSVTVYNHLESRGKVLFESAKQSLVSRIQKIIEIPSVQIYSDLTEQEIPLHQLITDSSIVPNQKCSDYGVFITTQINRITNFLNLEVPVQDNSLDQERKTMGDLIGFTNLENIKIASRAFFSEKDYLIIANCKTVEDILNTLNSQVSNNCFFRTRHIDRILDFALNEIRLYSTHIIESFDFLVKGKS